MTLVPLVAAIAWTAALIASSEPLGAPGSLLAGVGLLSMATVSTVGMTITGGRWARRLGIISVAATLILAAVRPVDVFWVVGLVVSATAGGALFLPQVTSRIRKLPAAAGPPQMAVVLPIVLLAFPFILGMVAGSSEPWAVLVVGLTAPIFAFGFARVIPGGLLGVRVLWPLLGLALSPSMGLWAGSVTATTAVVVGALAWRSDVKAAFHPPTETGTAYPIPPELVPGEIRDAAGIDDKGRRK